MDQHSVKLETITTPLQSSFRIDPASTPVSVPDSINLIANNINLVPNYSRESYPA
jgi:hypothetical protein